MSYSNCLMSQVLFSISKTLLILDQTIAAGNIQSTDMDCCYEGILWMNYEIEHVYRSIVLCMIG